ncbi:MAG: hypothetical protein R2699_05780 [Acidimicrobiales bacterium]
MGLLRHHDDTPSRRFQMQQRLLSVGDDSWIEDDQGQRVYLVDGKALRVRDTFELKDTSERSWPRSVSASCRCATRCTSS